MDPVIANGNAAATTFNPFTTDINTVRGQETGYATLNPLDRIWWINNFSDGNLKAHSVRMEQDKHLQHYVSSGKWYCEVLLGVSIRL